MAYVVLGCVIERASGQTFDVFLEENLQNFQILTLLFQFLLQKLTDLHLYMPIRDLGRLIPEMKNKNPRRPLND